MIVGHGYHLPSLGEMLQYAEIIGKLNHDLQNATNYFQQLKAFKNFYLSQEEKFLATHKRNPFAWCHSYPVDWHLYMTPIEFDAWISIRSKGRMVLYPQYPALNYHLDFGNPGFKIALEIDGRDFHSEGKDSKRDEALFDAGWKVYRITGSEIVKTDFTNLNDIRQDWYMSEQDAEDHLEKWLMHTGDGVIEAIRFVHFENSIEQDFADDNIFRSFSHYCYKTLHKHTYHD